MKKFVLCCFGLFFSLWMYGQESDIQHSHKFIPRENEEANLSMAKSYFTLSSTFSSQELSPFDARRYSLPIDLTSISLHNIDGQPDNINILALAKARERFRQSKIGDNDFLARQQKQIKSLMQINQTNTPWGRTSNDINFYGKRTPDGGIRNEAYEDVSQPFINPYYSPYGYYNLPFRSPYNRNGFHYGFRGYRY